MSALDASTSRELSLAQEVDAACNRFEQAWRKGRPRIEDYLEGWQGPGRAALLRELVLLEMDYRRKSCEPVPAEDYLARFPGLDPAWLASALSGEQKPSRLTVSLSQDTSGAEVPLPPQQVGDYEVLEEVARGGMGVVYKARQVSLGRTVALKMILAGGHAGTTELARFSSEARALARLQHANIVQVHEVGQHEGKPFFSLELCEGGSLDRKLAGNPLPPQQAGALVQTLARAMHAAHSVQVIHRDLKPANVLFAAGGVAKIADFGLAKRLDEAGQTNTGTVVGTPSYMAPEQAQGAKTIGPAADVYSLGAILYECLTGRPPFRSATMLDTILQVLHEEPVPPRRLNAHVPLDVETICLKCLDKSPGRRDGSAQALADDLGRWLNSEPIQARRAGACERASKWARRRPAVAALVAVSGLALIGLVAVLGISNVVVKEALTDRTRALSALSLEEEKTRQALADIQKEQQRTNDALTRETKALASRTKAFEDLGKAFRREQGARYLQGLLLAEQDWQANKIDRARTILDNLGPAELRGWEWHYLHRQLHASGARRFATNVTVTYASKVPLLPLSKDGKLLAMFAHGASGSTRYQVIEVSSGKPVFPLANASAKDGKYFSGGFALSPDGKWFAVAHALHASGKLACEVSVWAVGTGKREALRRYEMRQIKALAFHPDSDRLGLATMPFTPFPDPKMKGSTGRGNEVKIWDFAGDKEVTFPQQEEPSDFVIFSPNGKAVCSGGKVWDVERRQELFTLPGASLRIAFAAFSPDGKQLAVSSLDRTIKIVDAGSGREVRTFAGFTHPIQALAFSPDNARLAFGSDRTAQVMDIATGQILRTLRGHREPILAVGFPPRGEQLFVVDRSQVVLWGLAHPQEALTFRAGTGSGRQFTAAFSPDSQFVAAGGGKDIHVWHADTGELKTTLRGHQREVFSVAFSPDGAHLASGAADGTVRTWHLPAGKQERVFRPARARWVSRVVYSPDGLLLAAPHASGATVFDVATGAERHGFKSNRGWMSDAAFDPAGKHLATGSQHGLIQVWGLQTKKEVRTIKGEGAAYSLLYRDNGRQLVGTTRRGVRVWNAADGAEIATYPAGPVYTMAYSPDGKRLATVGGDWTIKIWDTTTREEVFSLKGHTSTVYSVAFSPDGRRIVSTSGDGTVRVWSAAP